MADSAVSRGWVVWSAISELIFLVEEAAEGGYVAKAPGQSIFTAAETLQELRELVCDAVRCRFDDRQRPPMVRRHFVREEILAD